LYAIARRPKARLQVDTFRGDGKVLRGAFEVQIQDRWEPLPFVYPYGADVTGWTASCAYPYDRLTMIDGEGHVRIEGSPGIIMQLMANGFERSDDRRFTDLEILYVGQAYGSDGSRTALERLQSHSTLQKVYFESAQRNPDQSIWLVLFALEPLTLMTSIDGADNHIANPEADERPRLDRVLGAGVSEQVQINFTEAALIRYFQPEYNVMFRGVFPSPAHTTYAECYELDINALVLELQSERVDTRYYSPTRERAWMHMHRFLMHDAAARRDMFDFAFAREEPSAPSGEPAAR
jgi:hypothetical protein